MLNRRIFCGWMGDNLMPLSREKALLSIVKYSGCAVHLVNNMTVRYLEVEEHRVHPAFGYLSAVHKMDYLRAYLMHFHGGGYTDIKMTTEEWSRFFTRLEESHEVGLGYTEIGPYAVAAVGGPLETEMQANYSLLIGCCAFIFKPGTEFTAEWLRLVEEVLDQKLDELKEHPAQSPTDCSEHSKTGYPIKWTAILGDIFHPLVYRNHEKLLHVGIEPVLRIKR